jgi:uncharacterized membrane protein YdjX (TVP38/TMEM64 family)
MHRRRRFELRRRPDLKPAGEPGIGACEEGTRVAEAREIANAGRTGLPWARILLALVAVAALVALGRSAGGAVPRFAAWVEGLGFWGPAVFAFGYALAVVAFVPGSVLTLGAGAIFGVGPGTATVFVAATAGACASFLVARYFARSAIERRLAGNDRFAAIDRAVGQEGRKIVFLLRLSPVFPFNLLNYSLGLTGVRFVDYAVASVGMLPGTLLYVYLGSVVGDLAAIAGGETGARDASQQALFFGGLVVTAVVTILVTRIARRALAQATGE